MDIGGPQTPDRAFMAVYIDDHRVRAGCFCENPVAGPQRRVNQAAGGCLSADAVDMDNRAKRGQAGAVDAVFYIKIA